VRYTRSSMLDVIRQDYITTARAKGVRESLVIFRHAFRNALIPLITVVGLSLPLLVSGAVFIEVIFSWPGMGSLAVNAISQRDYPVIMGFNLVAAGVVLLSNLVADLAYSVADPRIRYA
jgi:peptide/nickel transport system permease protein